MRAERPVLLVDIDGVLNPYEVENCPEGYSEFEIFPDDDEPARLCVLHGVWLRELSEQFDLAWASAWAPTPTDGWAVLGLEEFPFVPMPAIPFPPAGKVPAIAAFVGERSAAWHDDVVTPEAHVWARERPAPTLLIEVDHRNGLQRRHVEGLMTWRAQVGASWWLAAEPAFWDAPQRMERRIRSGSVAAYLFPGGLRDELGGLGRLHVRHDGRGGRSR